MQIKGTIIALLPLQTGNGKNGEWKKQEFIIETSGQYQKKVCVTAWGRLVDYVPSIGTEVNVSFDIESREYNSRWYTEVKAFKIETVGKSAPEQNNDEQQYQAHAQERASAEFDESSLPF
jgi:hypothetical protein